MAFISGLSYDKFESTLHRVTLASELANKSGEGNLLISDGNLDNLANSGEALINRWNKEWNKKNFEVANGPSDYVVFFR